MTNLLRVKPKNLARGRVTQRTNWQATINTWFKYQLKELGKLEKKIFNERKENDTNR